MKKISLILLLMSLASCSANIEKRGYIFNDRSQEVLNEGMQKIDVLSVMGSPSTTSSSNGDKFYYISNKFYKYAFFTPREIERTIVVIGFDKNEIITSIEEYALRDGKVIDYKSEKTIPGGTEATILQDLLDSTGRYTSSEAIAGSIF